MLPTTTDRITKLPNVCGGDACIRGDRIPDWTLVNYRRLLGPIWTCFAIILPWPLRTCRPPGNTPLPIEMKLPVAFGTMKRAKKDLRSKANATLR